MTLHDIEKDITSRIAAKYNAFYLAGVDDEDAEDIIGEVTKDYAEKEYKEWSYAYGAMCKFGSCNPNLEDFGDPSFVSVANQWMMDVEKKNAAPVLIVRDVHLIFEGALRGDEQALKSVAAIKMLIMTMLYRHEESSDDKHPLIFFIGLRSSIPPMIERLLTLYEVDYPREDEIEAIIDERICEIADNVGFDEDDERSRREKKMLVNACRGLGRRAIRLILNRIYEKTGLICFDRDVERLVNDEKRQEISKGRVLVLEDVEETLDDIGGLEVLKGWLKERKRIIQSERAREFGVDTPKGVMIVGMPGCGKSMAAKATAKTFGVQLLRLDMGSLMGKYVGESEANMRRALQLAAAASPCILWLDEIEKAFSGVSANGGGEGMATRLYGYFLTWMQEKKEPVFVVATANRLELPPELFRRGRFDEVFYVDFPTKTEAEQILRLHLRKRCRQEERGSIDKLNLSSSLAKMFAGGSDLVYSGADVMSVASIALEKRFLSIDDAESQNPRPKLSIEDAVKAIIDGETVKPIGKTMKDEIKGIREKFRKMGLQSASKK